MEGSHSIPLIPHPEFNPYAAWPRATGSAFHYSSPANSAFKAEPRAVHLLQQLNQFCFLLADWPLTWSLPLLEVMEGEWPNPQATGDEEGKKRSHCSHNYSLTNPTHKGFSHVNLRDNHREWLSQDNHSLFAVSTSTLQRWKWYLLPLPERMSVHCKEKSTCTGKQQYTPLKVLHQGIWLWFHDFWQCILIALLSFQEAVLPRDSALQIIKWGTQEKHSANKWCIISENALFFIRLLI